MLKLTVVQFWELFVVVTPKLRKYQIFCRELSVEVWNYL